MVEEHSTPGPRSQLTERVVEFTAGDGFRCNVIHVQGPFPPHKGPVILVHGAGVRANIFRAPVQTNLVDLLIDEGYDVWLENWRASIDLQPNLWTLDQAALYDHPEAVKTVVRETGWEHVKAVIHCQGSTSFTMSAVAGLVPQVKTILSNAVSLHPVIPKVAELKLRLLVRFASPFYPYLDPQWGRRAPTLRAKLVSTFVKLTHHECDNLVCKIASFTYGVGYGVSPGKGHPTLWEHQNLNEETHEWIKQEFARVPRTFFRQIAKSVDVGHLTAANELPGLPSNFVAQAPQTDARFAFFAGELNRCFLPESQVKSFEYFSSRGNSNHALHLLPGYGHLDVFMGKNAARDVFPLMLAELDKP